MFNDLQALHASTDPFQYWASKYPTEDCLIKERKDLIRASFSYRYTTAPSQSLGFESCRLEYKKRTHLFGCIWTMLVSKTDKDSVLRLTGPLACSCMHSKSNSLLGNSQRTTATE